MFVYFFLGSSFFFHGFCLHLGWYWPLPKKGLSCFWHQEGLEEELKLLLWLTAVWLIRFEALIAVSWAWSLSSSNKVVTSVWEEHKKPYFLFKFGLMASRQRNESSWFVCPYKVITSIWLVSVAAVSNLSPFTPLVLKSIKFWADWAITALTD